MEKNEFFKCMQLHKLLKSRIKGNVYIIISNGTLSVNINAGRGIRYYRNINDIPYHIDFEKMVDEIIYDYKKFLNDRFFNNGGENICLG